MPLSSRVEFEQKIQEFFNKNNINPLQFKKILQEIKPSNGENAVIDILQLEQKLANLTTSDKIAGLKEIFKHSPVNFEFIKDLLTFITQHEQKQLESLSQEQRVLIELINIYPKGYDALAKLIDENLRELQQNIVIPSLKIQPQINVITSIESLITKLNDPNYLSQLQAKQGLLDYLLSPPYNKINLELAQKLKSLLSFSEGYAYFQVDNLTKKSKGRKTTLSSQIANSDTVTTKDYAFAAKNIIDFLHEQGHSYQDISNVLLNLPKRAKKKANIVIDDLVSFKIAFNKACEQKTNSFPQILTTIFSSPYHVFPDLFVQLKQTALNLAALLMVPQITQNETKKILPLEKLTSDHKAIILFLYSKNLTVKSLAESLKIPKLKTPKAFITDNINNFEGFKKAYEQLLTQTSTLEPKYILDQLLPTINDPFFEKTLSDIIALSHESIQEILKSSFPHATIPLLPGFDLNTSNIVETFSLPKVVAAQPISIKEQITVSRDLDNKIPQSTNEVSINLPSLKENSVTGPINKIKNPATSIPSRETKKDTESSQEVQSLTSTNLNTVSQNVQSNESDANQSTAFLLNELQEELTAKIDITELLNLLKQIEKNQEGYNASNPHIIYDLATLKQAYVEAQQQNITADPHTIFIKALSAPNQISKEMQYNLKNFFYTAQLGRNNALLKIHNVYVSSLEAFFYEKKISGKQLEQILFTLTTQTKNNSTIFTIDKEFSPTQHYTRTIEEQFKTFKAQYDQITQYNHTSTLTEALRITLALSVIYNPHPDFLRFLNKCVKNSQILYHAENSKLLLTAQEQEFYTNQTVQTNDQLLKEIELIKTSTQWDIQLQNQIKMIIPAVILEEYWRHPRAKLILLSVIANNCAIIPLTNDVFLFDPTKIDDIATFPQDHTALTTNFTPRTSVFFVILGILSTGKKGALIYIDYQWHAHGQQVDFQALSPADPAYKSEPEVNALDAVKKFLVTGNALPKIDSIALESITVIPSTWNKEQVVTLTIDSGNKISVLQPLYSLRPNVIVSCLTNQPEINSVDTPVLLNQK